MIVGRTRWPWCVTFRPNLFLIFVPIDAKICHGLVAVLVALPACIAGGACGDHGKVPSRCITSRLWRPAS
jgi:hypothetical protein